MEPHRIDERKYEIFIKSDIKDEKEFKNRLEVSEMLFKTIKDLPKDFKLKYKSHKKEKINNKEYEVYTLELNCRRIEAQLFLDNKLMSQLEKKSNKIVVKKAESPSKKDSYKLYEYQTSMEITIFDKIYIVNK